MKKERNATMCNEKSIVYSEKLMEQYYVTAGYQREELYVSVRVDEFSSVWLSVEETRTLEADFRRRLEKTMLYLSGGRLFISGDKPVRIDGLYLDLSKLCEEPKFYERRNGISLLWNPYVSGDELLMFERCSVASLLKCLKGVPKEERHFRFVDVTVYRE